MRFISNLNGFRWSDPAVLLLIAATVAQSEPLRYRGEYTWGHEVNSFCPAINSQCYWLSGDTDVRVRNELKALSTANTTKPYQPLCVVVEGEIDRDAPRSGFAIDYDGLFKAMRLFGECSATNIVTHGELQHHRWVLESIDGKALDVAAHEENIPELDFGENMHVSGNSGCNRFSGRATFQDARLDFGNLMSTAMSCGPAQNQIEATVLQVLGNKPQLKLRENYLLLASNGTELLFRLRDWLE